MRDVDRSVRPHPHPWAGKAVRAELGRKVGRVDLIGSFGRSTCCGQCPWPGSGGGVAAPPA
jgi:hypothetical protein